MLADGHVEGTLQLLKRYGDPLSNREYLQNIIPTHFGISLNIHSHEMIETLRMPIFRPLNTLNPAESFFALDTHMVKQVYNTLVEYDKKEHKILPALAHYWESINEGKEWVFYLRKRALFHHHQEVTADDVKYSIRNLVSTKSAWLVRNIESIEVLNRYCIKIKLSTANQLFPIFLSYPQLSIIPQSVHGLKDSLPIGTGPYKVTKFTEDLCTLEAFESYYDLSPLLDRIEIYNLSPFQDEEVSFNRETDLLYVDTGESNIKNIPHWDQQKEICGTTVLTINKRKASIMMDPLFRKALHHLINREKMIRELGALRASPSHSFHYEEIVSPIDIEYNLKLGQLLLEQSNYAGETLQLFTYARHKEDATWLINEWQKHGIKIDVRLYSWHEMLDERVVYEADLVLFEAIISEGITPIIAYYSSDNSFLKQHLSKENIDFISSFLEDLWAKTSNHQDIVLALKSIEKQLLVDNSLIFFKL